MNLPKQQPSFRTDLTIERLDCAAEPPIDGITKTQQNISGMTVYTVEVTNPDTAKQIGKQVGTYITIEPTDFEKTPHNFETEVTLIAQQLESLFPKQRDSALVVGLGNAYITPDALGPQVTRYTLVTRHFSKQHIPELEKMFPVSAISPGVLGQTGIETSEIIAALSAQLHPSMILVIDALASKSLSRLGKTVQISNTGISPGSGVMNHRQEISTQVLGIPVISLGVPTVVDFKTIAEEYTNSKIEHDKHTNNMFVTPRGIDLLIEHAAKVIAYSINKAFHPDLSVSDIASLVS